MAIIIGAVTILVIFLGIFFQNKIQRDEEFKRIRNLYDIMFFCKFFTELQQNGDMNEFLRNGETIHVTRKIEKSDKKVGFKTKYEESYPLCYCFTLKNKTFEVYDYILQEHKSLYRLMSNTRFDCNINRSRIRVEFNNLYEDFITTSSLKSILQSLSLLLESEATYISNKEFIYCKNDEIEATKKLTKKIEGFLLSAINL